MPCKYPDSIKEVPAETSDVFRVHSFAARVPGLLAAFAARAESEDELLLRAELRSTIDRLSGAFDEAASLEDDSTHAAVLRAAALVAHELAGVAEPVQSDH